MPCMPKIMKVNDMKKNLFVMICALLLVSCAATQTVKNRVLGSNSGFVPNLPDVPMPKNFVIDANTSTFFDSAEGRIAEINAEGFGEVSEIQSFYAGTMPQFGWTQLSPTTFKKQGELLVVDVSKAKTVTSVKYQLRPSL